MLKAGTYSWHISWNISAPKRLRIGPTGPIHVAIPQAITPRGHQDPSRSEVQ